MTHWTLHAISRAWERYRLALTAADMRDIHRATQDGRASRIRTDAAGGTTFAFKFCGQWIFPVKPEGRDVIVTFQPSDFLVAAGAKAHRKAVRGQRARRAFNPKGREPYNRKRLAFADE